MDYILSIKYVRNGRQENIFVLKVKNYELYFEPFIYCYLEASYLVYQVRIGKQLADLHSLIYILKIHSAWYSSKQYTRL